MFARTVDDPFCNELIQNFTSGLQPEKAVRCSAREMFKFAVFLEACTTSIQRLHVLASLSKFADFAAQSNYDMSVYVINENIDNSQMRDIALRRLEKGYLHASWVVEQCKSNDFELIPLYDDDPLAESDRPPHVATLMDYRTMVESAQATTLSPLQLELRHTYLRQLVARSHSASLRISAKSGDEWAIRSYRFSDGVDVAFTKDVFELYPILKHRNLESRYFYGGLTALERDHHRSKAYLLLEDLAGSDAARREFDISDLDEAIDYVRTGGKLSYPRSWTESPVEARERLDKAKKLRQDQERFELQQEARSSGMFQ